MSSPSAEEKAVDIDIARLVGALWKRRLAVLLSTAAFAGAAFGLATLVPPSYRADTQIVIESGAPADARGDGADEGEGAPGPDGVESQVSLMTSPEVLGTVAERLGLAGRPEFAAAPSLLGRLFTRLRPQSEAPAGAVLETMRDGLKVYRKANRRVVVVEFSSYDPVLARDVPNAVAAEYLSRRTGAFAASDAGAAGWLEREIADLREAVRTAEGKVAAFRASSGLFVGGEPSGLATRQLAEIAAELSRIRAAREAAEARAQAIRAAVERGQPLDAVPEILSSPSLQPLHARQIALKSGIADLSPTLLDGHPRMRLLRSHLRVVEQEMSAAAANLRSSLETEADAARRRESALGAEMERLKGESARAGEAEAELRALEREATAQSQLLESHRNRYREVVARGPRDEPGADLPVDARVFSEAQLPAEPYFPKVAPITAAAGLAGFLFAAIGILLSELFSGRAQRRTPAFAVVPGIPRPPREDAPMAAPMPVPMPAPEIAPDGPPRVPTEVDDGQPASPAAPSDVQASIGNAIAELAEAIVASEVSRILFVSSASGARPGSVALARSLAGQSRSTILVDLTDGNEAARAMGVPGDAEGAGDLVEGTASFADVIHRDLVTSAHVLPSGGFSALGAPADAAEEIGVVLEALGKAYDCTMVDCGAMPADMLKLLMDRDAALVVAVEPGGEEAGEATLRRLVEAGLDDVVLLHLGPPAEAASQAA